MGTNELYEEQRQTLFNTITEQNKKLVIIEDTKVSMPIFTEFSSYMKEFCEAEQ